MPRIQEMVQAGAIVLGRTGRDGPVAWVGVQPRLGQAPQGGGVPLPRGPHGEGTTLRRVEAQPRVQAVIGGTEIRDTGPLSRHIGVGRAFMLSCVLFPAPLLLVPAASGHSLTRLALLFLAEFGSGLGVMILDISIGTIFVTVISDTIRASGSGAYRMVNYGMRPFGALTGGLLGALIGVRPTLWLAASGGVFCVVWVVFSPLARDQKSFAAASGESDTHDEA